VTPQPPRADDRAAVADLVPVPADRDLPANRQQAIRAHLMSEYPGSRGGAVTGSRTWRERWMRGPRLPRVVVAAALAVTAAVTGIVLAATGTAPSPSSPSSGGCVLPLTGNDPIHGGHQTTIGGAQSAAGFPIAVPHTALADRRTLSQVWVSPRSSLVALLYRQRKIKILIMPWPVTQSPARWFRYERRIMIKKYVTIGRVNGTPALIVLKPNIDACHANPASVEFSWHGLDISVYSRSYGAATLLKIADSMY
jgi:hypothetical protein